MDWYHWQPNWSQRQWFIKRNGACSNMLRTTGRPPTVTARGERVFLRYFYFFPPTPRHPSAARPRSEKTTKGKELSQHTYSCRPSHITSRQQPRGDRRRSFIIAVPIDGTGASHCRCVWKRFDVKICTALSIGLPRLVVSVARARRTLLIIADDEYIRSKKKIIGKY